MTFLAPGFFFASLAAAVAIVALHFIVTRQPRAGVLPTARFVPDLPATATARATRPSDVLLMLLRVLMVLAIGAGLSRPVLKPSREADSRVILVDASRAASDIDAVRDSVRSVYRERDALIVFDSSARLIAAGAADSIQSIRETDARGNLSAGLIAAVRAGSALRESADSIELVIVSPLAADAFDAATRSVRELWPGRARLIVVGGVPATPDTTTTRADVDWPASGRPRGSIERMSRDTIGGVVAGDAVVVAAFERRWTYPADSLRGALVVARWIDGEPAAAEWKSDDSCIRSVSIPVPARGDLVLRRDFTAMTGELSSPCASDRPAVLADADDIAALTGTGGLAARDSFRPRSDAQSWLAPWLIGLGLLAAIAELFVRRRASRRMVASSPSQPRMASAA